MSDTPITDREELCTTDYILPQFVVTSDICRELERENQQLKQTVLATLSQRGQKELIVAWDRVKELERENSALRKALEEAFAESDDTVRFHIVRNAVEALKKAQP